MGHIFTFYSYKGGVGRSMALANVATVLSQWRYSTLIVDWDFEAPGLEHFFKRYTALTGIKERNGLIDLLFEHKITDKDPQDASWRDLIVSMSLKDSLQPIHMLTAGRRADEDEYFTKVRSFDVKDFYLNKQGGYLIEHLRDQWREQYDFVLIDSRTGVTDLGGVCTIQLPDVLVLMFTPTEQGLEGTSRVAAKVLADRQALPTDRLKLLRLPIASRLDIDAGGEQSKEWIRTASEKLEPLYADWLPTDVRRLDFLELTKLPYRTSFSFGERLAVLEENAVIPSGLAYAYVTIAALVANKLEGAVLLLKNRQQYLDAASHQDVNAIDAVPTGTISEAELEEHRRWIESQESAGKPLAVANRQCRSASLRGVNLTRAKLVQCDFSAADLSESKLVEADLTESTFQGANLAGADLSKANLQRANLIDADLSGASLQQARLCFSNLEGALLEDTSLVGADLTAANLGRANLSGAQLTAVDLTKADFRDVRGLVKGQLKQAKLGEARIPDHPDILAIDQVHQLSQRALSIFGLLIGFLLLGSSALAFSDYEITTSMVRLPIIHVNFMTRWFFILVPLGVLSLSIYYNRHFVKLITELVALPAVFPDGTPLGKRPGLVLNKWVGSAMSGKREPNNDRVLIVLSHVGPFVVLLLLWSRYLARQDWIITAFHIAAIVAVGIAAIGNYWQVRKLVYGPAVIESEREEFATTLGNNIKRVIYANGLAVSGITFALSLGAVLFALSFGAINGIPPNGYSTDESVSDWDLRKVVPKLFGQIGVNIFPQLRSPEPEVDQSEAVLRKMGPKTDEMERIVVERKGNDGDFRHRSLRYAQGDKAFLPSSKMEEANLWGANLTDSYLSWSNLERIILKGAVLKRAKLDETSLSNADLSAADLSDATVRKAVVRNADLRGAWLVRTNFEGADLSEANLELANVEKANFAHSRLDGVNLTQVKNLYLSQLLSAKINYQTVLPKDLDAFFQTESEYMKLLTSLGSDNSTERAGAMKKLMGLWKEMRRFVIVVLEDDGLPRSVRLNVLEAVSIIRRQRDTDFDEDENIFASIIDMTLESDKEISSKASRYLKRYADSDLVFDYYTYLASKHAQPQMEKLSEVALDVLYDLGIREKDRYRNAADDDQIKKSIDAFRKAWDLQYKVIVQNPIVYTKALYGWGLALHDRSWIRRRPDGTRDPDLVKQAQVKFREFLLEVQRLGGSSQYPYPWHLSSAKSYIEKPVPESLAQRHYVE